MRRQLLVSALAVFLLSAFSANPLDAHAFEIRAPKADEQAVKESLGKLDSFLSALYAENMKVTQGSGSDVQSSETDRQRTQRDDWVTIDAVSASEDPAELVKALRDLGAKNVTAYGRMVSAKIRIDDLGALETLSSLRFARAAVSMRQAGSVQSEGDEAVRARMARERFYVHGRGSVIGTLSDSFDCFGEAADDRATGDLLQNVIVLDDSACDDGTDEGRAMIQIMHDLAPQAQHAFHTAFNGQADFANGIVELTKRARSNIIVDDIIYFAEPMFQDGVIAQAVTEVQSKRVAYFSAAGNSGRKSWESGEQGFVPSGAIGAFGERHDFDPGPGVDDLQTVLLGSGVTIFSFQWDEPFFSVSGPPGSRNDVDFLVYQADGSRYPRDLVVQGIGANVGGDPVEVVAVFNPRFPVEIAIAIELVEGPAPRLMKYVAFGSLIEVVEYPSLSSTIYGHANSKHAGSVGAADFLDTPPFGVSPAKIEPFSSAGGTPILFDTEGNRLPAPTARQKPDFVGPDRVSTTVPGFETFPGTSAAAPHAAAVAALMREADQTLSPDELYQILEGTARDMDDPETERFDEGFDFATGAGLIDAVNAVAEAIERIQANGQVAAANQ